MFSYGRASKLFVGVHVSKASLDVFRPDTNESFQIKNSDEAITVLCSQLEKKKRQLMLVIKSTPTSNDRQQNLIEYRSPCQKNLGGSGAGP